MEIIKQHKPFLFLLILSLSFFLFKGIRYMLIDSYIPLLFISLMILGLCTFFYRDKKYFKVAIMIWSIFLMVWSLLRLIIPFLFYITPHITETHIREQFTIPEFIISLLILSIGYYLWKHRKELPNASKQTIKL